VNESEKKAVLAALKVVEFYFFENAALKTMLTLNVPNWKARLQSLATDRSLEEEMRAKFRHLYESFEQSPDESVLIEAFLRVFPKSGTLH
jgi:hypothetical protein